MLHVEEYARYSPKKMDGCCDLLRSEFKLKQLGFSTIVYDRMFHSQWRVHPIVLIVYKVLLMVYVDFWLIYTAVQYKDIDVSGTGTYITWPAWLTNWTYTLLALHLTMSTVALMVYHLVRFSYNRSWLCVRTSSEHWSLMHEGINQRETTGDSYSTDGTKPQVIVRGRCAPWYVVVLWILFDMASVAVPMVTLMFFIFLWPAMSGNGGIDNENLQLHGLNSVCLFIDFALSPVPVRLLHVLYPVIYGIFYLIFSAIYWDGDHNRVLYKGVLDWNSPGTTVGMIFLVLAVMVVLQIIFFALHKLKMFIYYRLYSTDFYESIGD